MTKSKNQYGVWKRYFEDQSNYDRLKNDAQFLTSFFKANINLSDEDNSLDSWVATPQAQKILTALIIDIKTHILSVTDFALPAHDIRQILFKDLAEGLRFYQMEKPQGFKSTFMIPMMAHDIGRLLEGRFFHPNNPHENWIPHSQLSYLLLKAILDKPDYRDIPEALKNHFLYAVATHSGDNGQTYMSRAVQTCDRMQMIGSEGFFRALSYVVCLMKGQIKYPADQYYRQNLPDMNDHKSVLSLLEYFSRNMRENIGIKHPQWQRRIMVENAAILMMACPNDKALYRKIFAPELNPSESYGTHKQKMSDDIFESARALSALHTDTYPLLSSPNDVTGKIFELLESPVGSAKLKDDMKLQINRAMSCLQLNERYSLHQALCLAESLRRQQDRCDRKIIMSIGSEAPEYIQLIANSAKRFCPAPPNFLLESRSSLFERHLNI